MNTRPRFALIFCLVCAIAFPLLAEPSPQAALEAVKQLRTDRKFTEAADKAKEAVKDIDPAKVEIADAAGWCELYSAAQDFKGLQSVAERWAANATGEDKFKAQQLLITADARLKNMKGVAKTLAEIKPANQTDAVRMATLANNYVSTAFTSADKETAMKILSAGEALVPKNVNDEKTKASVDKVAADLAATRKTIEENPGKEAEVLAKQRTEALKAILAQRSNPEAQAKARQERDAKLEKFIGQDAPEINTINTLGEFKSMASLKGKVVVLDFFAHWCGPCKAALPSVRAMYDDLKGKGFEVVGVTRYYGTYAKEKGLKPEEEYDRMKQFIVEQKMNWPIAFVNQDVFNAYGVSGIPHVVVIDRKGKIHKVKVGYYKDQTEAFHKEIEKLLKG